MYVFIKFFIFIEDRFLISFVSVIFILTFISVVMNREYGV